MKDELGKLYYLKILNNYHLSVFEWLKQHPDIHIPKIIQFEEKNEKLIVLEEYIDGITLEQLLVHEISMRERKDILNQIFDGISYLHHADPSIIHRDIKPSNIMIDQNRIIKIIDYDAAKLYVKINREILYCLEQMGLQLQNSMDLVRVIQEQIFMH